jgi:selenide, water dikinase
VTPHADPDAPVRLTAYSHGAGCACKLSLDELAGVLDGIAWIDHPQLLVGIRTGDDAAVWRQHDGRVLVATTDFFTPLVDDAATWGRIAAANAVSDVYAMGATPRFALNIVGWPRALPSGLLVQVLEGALTVARDAGYPVVGGHSIDSQEPLFGQVVIGDVAEEELLTNAGAQPGQALVLTKPLGTGIVTTALKRAPTTTHPDGSPLRVAYDAAVASMTRLNRAAARAASSARATAATDVTGFGLLGHLHRLALASGVACTVDAERVPLLPGILDLVDQGAVPGGTERNVAQSDRFVSTPSDRRSMQVLCDAQTSGGLLLSVPPERADALVADLVADGHVAAHLGEVRDGEAGTIDLRGHVR